MIQIEDPDDPRIAPYRNVRERDLVGREGLFIAEGEVVLRRLIHSPRFETCSVLLASKRADALEPVVRAARPSAPVYWARQTVLDAIAGFPLHRGVLAVGRRGQEPTASDLLAQAPTPSIVLVLVGVANHDNMGGLFRNAAAFGAAALILDSTSCDPLYRKAIRVSVGAVLETPFARLEAHEDSLGLLAANGFEALALSPSGQERLSDIAPTGRTAILLGAEGSGLPGTILNRSRTVRIPMAQGFDSLNIATSSGIVLHHLASRLAP